MIQALAPSLLPIPGERRAGIRVLEIGCGTGANIWMWAKEGFDTWGIDSSPAAIELARNHTSAKWNVSLNLLVAQFDALPFASSSFDVVLDVVSLQHCTLRDSGPALAEIARCLKPGGIFFSYRLANSGDLVERHGGSWIDECTVDNISEPSLPLAGNGVTSFWSPETVNTNYRIVGLDPGRIDTYSRRYGDSDVKVDYLAITAARLKE